MCIHRKLVVISGITGGGKTTLAEAMYRRYENSIMLSVNSIKEFINDEIGYKNRIERDLNNDIASDFFVVLLEEAMMRGEEIVIVEYSFREKWSSIFWGLVDRFGYEYIVINVYGKNFDMIWANLEDRDSSPDRHLSHSMLDYYNIRDNSEYSPVNALSYVSLKRCYDLGLFTYLSGKKNYSFINDFKEESITRFLDRLELQ